jgi:hypothetical protein
MFTIKVHCLTHDTEIEDVGWWPLDNGQFRFEYDNCPKGQIIKAVGGCDAKVVMSEDDKYVGDLLVEEHQIAEFLSKEYE